MNIVGAWNRLLNVPGRGRLFNLFLKAFVPYTGALGAEVEVLKPGYAKLKLRDRRGVRNHLNCIHAVALVNLCEATSGLALMSSLPENNQAILVGFSIEYLKKARGTILSECHITLPNVTDRTKLTIETSVVDRAGDTVCKGKAQWLVQPKAETANSPK